MTLTNKKNGVENVGRGRDRLDNSEVFICNAFGGFRGRFPFSDDRFGESRRKEK